MVTYAGELRMLELRTLGFFTPCHESPGMRRPHGMAWARRKAARASATTDCRFRSDEIRRGSTRSRRSRAAPRAPGSCPEAECRPHHIAGGRGRSAQAGCGSSRRYRPPADHVPGVGAADDVLDSPPGRRALEGAAGTLEVIECLGIEDVVPREKREHHHTRPVDRDEVRSLPQTRARWVEWAHRSGRYGR